MEDERSSSNFSAHRKSARNPRSSKIPYPIVDRFEISTDETGLKSFKLPQEEADRMNACSNVGFQFTMQPRLLYYARTINVDFYNFTTRRSLQPLT